MGIRERSAFSVQLRNIEYGGVQRSALGILNGMIYSRRRLLVLNHSGIIILRSGVVVHRPCSCREVFTSAVSRVCGLKGGGARNLPPTSPMRISSIHHAQLEGSHLLLRFAPGSPRQI